MGNFNSVKNIILCAVKGSKLKTVYIPVEEANYTEHENEECESGGHP